MNEGVKPNCPAEKFWLPPALLTLIMPSSTCTYSAGLGLALGPGAGAGGHGGCEGPPHSVSASAAEGAMHAPTSVMMTSSGHRNRPVPIAISPRRAHCTTD